MPWLRAPVCLALAVLCVLSAGFVSFVLIELRSLLAVAGTINTEASVLRRDAEELQRDAELVI